MEPQPRLARYWLGASRHDLQIPVIGEYAPALPARGLPGYAKHLQVLQRSGDRRDGQSKRFRCRTDIHQRLFLHIFVYPQRGRRRAAQRL